MALKRYYEDSTKYLYARIVSVFYRKTHPVDITLEMWERDDANPDHDVKCGSNHNYIVQHPSTNDPFAISALSVENINIVKASYNWVKDNIDLFRDFSDC